MGVNRKDNVGTMERHKAVLRSFVSARGRGPRMTYSKITDEEERKAYLALVYIRSNGSFRERVAADRLVRKASEGDEAQSFDVMYGKLSSFLSRNGRRPSPQGANIVERRIANWLYRVMSDGDEGERSRVSDLLARHGLDYGNYRTREELFEDLESFMRRSRRFPVPGESDLEKALYDFAGRVVRSGDADEVARVQGLVMEYDEANTCSLFVPVGERMGEYGDAEDFGNDDLAWFFRKRGAGGNFTMDARWGDEDGESESRAPVQDEGVDGGFRFMKVTVDDYRNSAEFGVRVNVLSDGSLIMRTDFGNYHVTAKTPFYAVKEGRRVGFYPEPLFRNVFTVDGDRCSRRVREQGMPEASVKARMNVKACMKIY